MWPLLLLSVTPGPWAGAGSGTGPRGLLRLTGHRQHHARIRKLTLLRVSMSSSVALARDRSGLCEKHTGIPCLFCEFALKQGTDISVTPSQHIWIIQVLIETVKVWQSMDLDVISSGNLCSSLTLVDYLTSVSLNFLFCKMGTIMYIPTKPPSPVPSR